MKLDEPIKEFQELVTQLENSLIKKNPELLMSVEHVTPVQFATGMALIEHGPMTMGHVAKNIGVKLSNLTGIIDRMVGKKYVIRIRDEEDRRVVKVRLTPVGKKVISRIYEEKLKYLRLIMNHLNRSEQKQFITLLRKIVSSLKK